MQSDEYNSAHNRLRRFRDIANNRKVIVYNQEGFKNSAQVGQGYGGACWRQGGTSLRSAWVSCQTSK